VSTLKVCTRTQQFIDEAIYSSSASASTLGFKGQSWHGGPHDTSPVGWITNCANSHRHPGRDVMPNPSAVTLTPSLPPPPMSHPAAPIVDPGPISPIVFAAPSTPSCTSPAHGTLAAVGSASSSPLSSLSSLLTASLVSDNTAASAVPIEGLSRVGDSVVDYDQLVRTLARVDLSVKELKLADLCRRYPYSAGHVFHTQYVCLNDSCVYKS
jgi:hypothetical protein